MISRKKFGSICLLILLLFLGSTAYGDEDLAIKSWNIDSKILDNGDLEITEDISFYFNSNFTSLSRSIDLDGHKIEDLKIQEVGGQGLEYKLVNQAQDGDSASYTLEEGPEGLDIKIYSYFEYEEKTFRFTYRLKDKVINYKDISDFRHSFINENTSYYIENLNIKIRLPKDRTEQVKVFKHGDNEGQMTFIDDNLLEITSDYLDKDLDLEIRILLPPGYIDRPSQIKDEDMLELILKQEESYSKNKARDRSIKSRREEGVELLSYIAIFLGALLLLLAYSKTRHDNKSLENILDNKMAYLPPAIVTSLSRMPFDSNMILTTIFNLCKQGHMVIKEAGSFENSASKETLPNFKLVLLDRNRRDLLDHELFFLDWFFKEISQGQSISTEELYRYSRKNNSNFNETFREWCEKVSKDLEDLGLKDNSLIRFGIFLIAGGLILLILSIFNIIIYRKLFRGLVLFIIFLGLTIFGIELTQKLTDLGYIQYNKLMNLKKMIIEGELEIKDEKILIIALALGIDMKHIKEFEPNFIDKNTPKDSWLQHYFTLDSDSKNIFSESLSWATGLDDFKREK